MLSWIKCVFFRGGHRFGRRWWKDRHDGGGTHRLCEECVCLVIPANRNSWARRERAGQGGVARRELSRD